MKAARMHVSVPSRKTIFEQLPAALTAVGIAVFLGFVIPTGYPMRLTDGSIDPPVAAIGDKVTINWTQSWHELCPLTITREFVGSDNFKATTATVAIDPPDHKGIRTRDRPLIIPKMATGMASYQSTIRPHCLFDMLIHQREYQSPVLKVMVLPAPVPGPR